MIAARERLPDRRPSVSFSFECNGLHYTATISRYAEGRLAEIFICIITSVLPSAGRKPLPIICRNRPSDRVGKWSKTLFDRRLRILKQREWAGLSVMPKASWIG